MPTATASQIRNRARHFATHAGILYHLDFLLTPDDEPTWQICIPAFLEDAVAEDAHRGGLGGTSAR